MSKIRPYTLQDRTQCLDIFDGNTPQYFAHHERELFQNYLSRDDIEYFILSDQDKVLGCGGYSMEMHGVAYLTWGMIRRDSHRQGLGAQLLRYRLERIRAIEIAWCIVIHTSQFSAPFFAAQQFEQYHQIDHGYSKGLHQCFMRLVLR